MKLNEKLKNSMRRVKALFVSNETQRLVLSIEDFFPSDKFHGITYLKNSSKTINKKQSWWQKINLRTSTVVAIFLEVLMMINFVMGVGNYDKFVETVETIVFFFGGSFVLLRNFYLTYYKRDEIEKIIERLKQHFPQSHQEQNQIGADKCQSDIKNLNLFYTFLHFGVWLHFVCTALFMFCSGLGIELLMPIYFPLDPRQPLLYPIFFILESWCLFSYAAMVVSADLILFSLVRVTSMEFELVAQKIRRIDKENDENCEKMMKEIIDGHNELTGIANEINEIFSPILLAHVFAAMFVLCASLFLLFVSTNFKLFLI
jgi:hypothetical protein